MKNRKQDWAYWPPNRLPPEKVAAILEGLRLHSNACVVARQARVSHVTVWRYAKAAGIRLEKGKAVQRRARKPPEKRRQIIDALRANPSATAVARKLGGVAASSVRKMAISEGIKLPRRYNRLPEDKVREIVAALTINPNARQVARQIGDVNHVTVLNIAKRHGIRLLGRGRRVLADRCDEAG
jgi:hypothetical protein